MPNYPTVTKLPRTTVLTETSERLQEVRHEHNLQREEAVLSEISRRDLDGIVVGIAHLDRLWAHLLSWEYFNFETRITRPALK